MSVFSSPLFPLGREEEKERWKKEFIESIQPPETDIMNGLIHALYYSTENNQINRNPYIRPVYIEYSRNGSISWVENQFNDITHNSTKLESICVAYYADGSIWSKHYRVNDVLHRSPEAGPAYIEYYKNGQIFHEDYWVNNKRHRLLSDGPASILYCENGQISSIEYWVDGKRVYTPSQ